LLILKWILRILKLLNLKRLNLKLLNLKLLTLILNLNCRIMYNRNRGSRTTSVALCTMCLLSTSALMYTTEGMEKGLSHLPDTEAMRKATEGYVDESQQAKAWFVEHYDVDYRVDKDGNPDKSKPLKAARGPAYVTVREVFKDFQLYAKGDAELESIDLKGFKKRVNTHFASLDSKEFIATDPQKLREKKSGELKWFGVWPKGRQTPGDAASK